MNSVNKIYRNYGYEVLINNLEPLLRHIIINKIIYPSYGSLKWKEAIPKGVLETLEVEGKISGINNIESFFEELYLWCLKEIIIQKKIYPLSIDIIGEDIAKEDFLSIMDELNEHRKKIAHAKSNYTKYDFEILLEKLRLLFKGDLLKDFINFLDRGGYKKDIDIPESFFETDICNNNLPIEEYDLDGGFVGRRKEVKTIKKLLFSNQDRIVTITGAGGLGKTAIALKCAYSILATSNSPYGNIIWLSAKESKLTSENGIVEIDSQISSFLLMMQDILKILDQNIFEVYIDTDVGEDIYKNTIYKCFLNTRSLLIIDNLETITNKDIIKFIKDIPRPSQVLITSRKGLRECERRYPLPEFPVQDAVKLFRIIAKEKNRLDLLKLKQKNIEALVKKVKTYPLLIKWTIGKICLGMEIKQVFEKIYSGNSEISEFIFNDIFNLININTRKCLYSMVVFGEKPISKYLIQHMTGFDDDLLEDSIEELIITSFVYPELNDDKDTFSTHYIMLSLTRDFVQKKLDLEKEIQRELATKYHDLSYQIEQTEKSKIAFFDSLSSYGINTEEDKIAFNYVKTAKIYIKSNNEVKAAEFFEKAIKISPELTYVILEYGKFETSLGHIDSAKKIFIKACEIDSTNYHSHYAYGIFLRKQNELKDSIRHLEQAKKINKDFLPIYNELGRAYSFVGNYDKANEQFEFTKNYKQDHINYKRLNITLHYQSDNFSRWAEEFFKRKDTEAGKKILFKSLETVKEANSLTSHDNKNLLLEKKISKDIGLCLMRSGDFEAGKLYLLEASKKIYSQNQSDILNNKIACQSFYYLALNLHKYKKNIDEQIKYITEAQSLCSDDRFMQKIEKFKDQILDKNTKNGVIKFYNNYKKFGVIETINDEGYTFIISNFKYYITYEEIQNLEGKNVTFMEFLNIDKKKFAKNIIIKE